MKMTEEQKLEHQKAMKPFWDRLQWDWDHLLDSDINPFVKAGEGDAKPKERTGFEDITHAIKNIWVESRKLKKQRS